MATFQLRDGKGCSFDNQAVFRVSRALVPQRAIRKTQSRQGMGSMRNGNETELIRGIDSIRAALCSCIVTVLGLL
jgi:hypothetical protein